MTRGTSFIRKPRLNRIEYLVYTGRLRLHLSLGLKRDSGLYKQWLSTCWGNYRSAYRGRAPSLLIPNFFNQVSARPRVVSNLPTSEVRLIPGSSSWFEWFDVPRVHVSPATES
uniref:Uncharacterized protein n=1 Tax=Cacopsylla melanoneura TaxID=428564 RepID=A0A8D8WHC2_9HEMI